MTTNTTNIATLANSLGKLGKLNKKQLLALVERTYNDQNDPELKRVMAVIYKSIAPSVAIGKAEKDNWAWVCQAMAKNDVRFYLNYVYCNGIRVICTDGHRMHTVPNTFGLVPGYYDKQQNQVTDIDARYPDIDRIIPAKDTRELVYFNLEECEIKPAGKSQAVIIPERNGAGNVGIDEKYLKQAVAGMHQARAYAWVGSPSDSIMVHNGDRLAVVMPMRV